MDPSPLGEVRPQRVASLIRIILCCAALPSLAALAPACADEPARPPSPVADGRSGEVAGVERLPPPSAAPRVVTELSDPLGRPVSIACVTCHSLGGLSRTDRQVGEPLVAFHVGLQVDHGARVGLRCGSCHAGPDYGGLHLADGRELAYGEVTELCRQCHGPQARDFDHGAHGGMNGHWDKRFGDQQRHACTTCHDPHSPAFAAMWPARPPGDARWLGAHPKPSPSPDDASKEHSP